MPYYVRPVMEHAMPGSWTIHVRSRTGRTQRFGRARLTRMLRAALSGPQQQAHLAPHLADAMELFLRRRGCRTVSSGALTEMCLAALHGLGLDAAAQELDYYGLTAPRPTAQTLTTPASAAAV